MDDFIALFKRISLREAPVTFVAIGEPDELEKLDLQGLRSLCRGGDDEIILLRPHVSAEKRRLARLRLARNAAGLSVRLLFHPDPTSGRAFERAIAAARNPAIILFSKPYPPTGPMRDQLMEALSINDYVAGFRPRRYTLARRWIERPLWKLVAGAGPRDPLCPLIAVRRDAVLDVSIETSGALRFAELAAKMTALGRLTAETEVDLKASGDAHDTELTLAQVIREQWTQTKRLFLRPQLVRPCGGKNSDASKRCSLSQTPVRLAGPSDRPQEGRGHHPLRPRLAGRPTPPRSRRR